MKRILAFAALCLNIACFAQSGVRYDGRVTVAGTNVPSNANVPLMGVPNALVTICTDGTCTANQPIFSNQGINVPTSNPIKTDGQGRFGFYAAAGSYFYKVQLPSGNIQGIFPITLGGAGGGSVTPSISVAATSSSGVVQTATPSAVAGLFGCSSGQALGAGGTCIAPGTPVGTQYRIGAYTGAGSGASTQLGLTNSFTDATLNPLTVPGALAGKTTNGTTNTDLNGGIAPTISNCATTPCSADVPNNSPETSTVINSLINPANGQSWTMQDNRGGARVNYAQNINPNASFQAAYGENCNWARTGISGTFSGASNSLCHQANFVKVGGGISSDNAWTNVQYDGGQQSFNTRGQSYGYSRLLFFEKLGDSIVSDINAFFRGGATGFNDEANKVTAWHLTQQGTIAGTIGIGGSARGPSAIQLNFGIQNNGFVMDGGFLIASDEPTDTVTTYDSCASPTSTVPELCHTTTSHAADTWQAVLTAPCGSDNNRDIKTPVQCSVNVTVASTPPAVGKAVAIADTQKYESASVAVAPSAGTGAKTITLNLSLSHQTGTLINFGTMTPGVGVFSPLGSSDPSTVASEVISAFPIGGAPDATHEYVVVNYKEGLELLPIPYSPSESIFATGSCSAGTVSFPLGSFALDLNTIANGAQQWVVSGNSSSSANGVVTSVIAHGDGSASWTMPGGTCGSGFGTGGTIALTHTADVFTYCGSEVIGIEDGTLDADGQLAMNGNVALDGNNCLFATGARAMQPNRVESESQMYSSQYIVSVPSGGGNNRYATQSVTGLGMSGIALQDYTSGNAGSDWWGNGGPIHASPMAQYGMPVGGNTLSFGLESGKALYAILCPLEGCNTHMADTQLFQLAGASGAQEADFRWQGSVHQFRFFNPVNFFHGWTSYDNNTVGSATKMVYTSIFNVSQEWGECSPLAVSGKWCWGSNPTSGNAQDGQIETGNVQADVIHGLTGFNGTIQEPVCLLDGTDCPSGGGGGLTGQVTGFLPVAATATTSTGPSPIDYGITTSGVVTSSAPMAINSATTPSSMLYVPNGISPAVTTGAAGWGVQSGAITGGFYEMPAAPCSGLLNLTNTSGIVVTNCVTAAGGSTGAQGVMQEAGATAGSFQAGAITEGTSTLVSTKAIQANLTGSATAVNFATDALGTGMFSASNTNLQFSLNGTQGSSLTTAGWFLKTGVNCWGSSFTACSAGIGISSSNSYLNAYNSVTTGTAPTNSMATLFDFHAISTVASATTIAPTGSIINVSGTTAIATITPPTGVSTTLGTCIDIMPTGVFTFTTGGNISNPTAVTPAVGTPIRACWFGTAWAIK